MNILCLQAEHIQYLIYSYVKKIQINFDLATRYIFYSFKGVYQRIYISFYTRTKEMSS